MSYSPFAQGITASGQSLAGKFMATNAEGNFEFQDNDKLIFGADADASIYSNNSALLIANEASYPVTIGHADSTVTIPGDLTVTGTTTTVDTVTMNAANAIVFEGATANDEETTLTIIDPTADHTQYLINQGGYIPLLAVVTTTAITSTPEELNILDGVTSTAAELNILDGVTSTAAELNILDGVTSSTAELNILDGVTSTAAELNILDGVTSTAAELNILDGVTTTTAEINFIDGDTSRVSATIVDADGILLNDGGTMKMVLASSFKTYVGGSSSTVQSSFSNDDTVDNDYNLVSAAAGSLTVKVPENSTAGTKYTIKKTDASANTVTVSQTTADTIDGSATKILYFQHESLTVISDGANWHIV